MFCGANNWTPIYDKCVECSEEYYKAQEYDKMLQEEKVIDSSWSKVTSQKLVALKDGNRLKEHVIDEILEHDFEERESFIKDLLKNGCQSGMIGELVYYKDTRAFYIEYMEEIEELALDLEDANNEVVAPEKGTSNKYNWWAWFGYEEMMGKIAFELGIEY